MSISNLHDLFKHELADLYSVELQIINALPKMISAASNTDLKEALQEHLEETEKQLARLEVIYAEIGFSKKETCEGMKGIIAESKHDLSDITDHATKDAAIIALAQRVEHYEIAGYGTAVEYANLLGFEDIVDMLEETLQEEKTADNTLNDLAIGGWFSEGINEKA